MSRSDHSRRTVLKSAGLGVSAGLLSDLAPAVAAENAEIWAHEYWANKDGVKLNLWRKRIGAPAPGEQARPALFLVHGSSNSSRSSYDLGVPGKGEYSLMNVFARYGYDVWTMDHDGYGYSGSSGNNSDIASGVADLKAAIPVVLKETGRQKAHFYGTSSGGIRAAAYAQAQPEAVDRLMLCAFTYKGNGAAEIERRRKRIDALRASPRRKPGRGHDPLDLHARRPSFALRSGRARGDHRGGNEIRRHDPERHLSRYGREPADRRSRRKSSRQCSCCAENSTATRPMTTCSISIASFRTETASLSSCRRLRTAAGYSNNRHLLWYAMKNFLAAPAPTA